MGRKLPKIPKFSDLDKIIRATTRERDRLMLLLARWVGMRVSEIVKLDVPHLDFQRKFIAIVNAKGGKDRTLPCPRFLVGPLRGWVGTRTEGPVFESPRGGGRRLTTRTIQYLIKRLAKKAGLKNWDEDRLFHPHAFRHCFASEKVERGVDLPSLQQMLGHASLATTQIYIHTSPEHLRDAMNS